MGIRIAVVVVVVTLVSAVGAEAQKANWAESLGAGLKGGDTIYVTGSDGREVKGAFGKFSTDALTVFVNGEVRQIAMRDVTKVARRGDSVLNGFLIGAAFGGFSGVVLVAADCKPTIALSCGWPPAIIPGLALLDGGFFALIDWMIPGRTVVYRSPQRVTVAPVITPRQQGLRVAVAIR